MGWEMRIEVFFDISSNVEFFNFFLVFCEIDLICHFAWYFKYETQFNELISVENIALRKPIKIFRLE